MKKYFFLGFFMSVCGILSAQTTMYVTPGGAGTKNGSSWTNAYDSVAFRRALPKATSGTAFWVAAGIYKPADNRDSSFVIPTQVAVYGGFAGTETVLSQRNWLTNVTTLSGDIGKANDSIDNCYHIVLFNKVDTLAVLDGFTVTRGYASTQNPNYTYASGAAIYANGGGAGNSSSPKINNCIFIHNGATLGGGAIYLNGVTGISNAVITNCTFTKNWSGEGGAIWVDGSTTGQSNPVIKNCTFTYNTAISGSEFGGAIFNDGFKGICSPLITNCVFANNTGGFGGAVYNDANTGTCNAVYTNCTFTKNNAPSLSYGKGGAVYDDAQGTVSCAPKFLNCIFWKDTSVSVPIPGIEIFNTSSAATPTVNYSDIDVTAALGGFTGANNINANPMFADAALGDYWLLPCSPAVNTGTATGAPTTDILGNPRPAAGGYDMGAYQLQTKAVTATLIANPGIVLCSGSVTIAANTVNIGPAATYQWQDSTTGGWANISNTTPYSGVTTDTLKISTVTSALNGFKYRCKIVNACGNYTSDSLTLTISNSKDSISIISTADTVCSSTHVTFTATTFNGGTNPTYQWKVNGANVGTNNAIYIDSTIHNDDTVTCVLTSNASCVGTNGVASNKIILHLKVNSSTIINNNICQGDSILFNGKEYHDSGTYVANFVNSIGCDSVITLKLSITRSVIPGVSITATPDTIVCRGTIVTFKATAIGGGTSPLYSWEINNGNVGTNKNTYIDSIVHNKDHITCIITSSAKCASPATASYTITMHVSNAIAAFGYTINKLAVTFHDSSANANNWLWEFGDGDTSHMHNPSHTYKKAGIDTIKLIVTGPCGNDTTTKILNITTSIVGINVSNTIHIYPNPNTGHFILEYNTYNAKEPVIIDVIDILGQVVYTEQLPAGSNTQNKELNIQTASGTYIIRVTQGTNTYINRMVIQQ